MPLKVRIPLWMYPFTLPDSVEVTAIESPAIKGAELLFWQNPLKGKTQEISRKKKVKYLFIILNLMIWNSKILSARQ
jgi:hypothetical protein